MEDGVQFFLGKTPFFGSGSDLIHQLAKGGGSGLVFANEYAPEHAEPVPVFGGRRREDAGRSFVYFHIDGGYHGFSSNLF